MPDQVHPTSVVSRSHRFSLRTAFAATTCLAVATALFGALYRAAGPDNQKLLLTYWAAFCVFFPLVYWSRERSRAKTFGKLGSVAFFLPTGLGLPNARLPSKKRLLFSRSLGLVICLLAYSLMLAAPSRFVPAFVAIAFCMALVTALVASDLLSLYVFEWSCCLIGSHAILHHGTRLSWRRIHRVDHGVNRSNLRYIRLSKRRSFSREFTFFIPAGEEPAVDAYIADRLAEAHGDNQTVSNPT